MLQGVCWAGTVAGPLVIAYRRLPALSYELVVPVVLFLKGFSESSTAICGLRVANAIYVVVVGAWLSVGFE